MRRGHRDAGTDECGDHRGDDGNHCAHVGYDPRVHHWHERHRERIGGDDGDAHHDRHWRRHSRRDTDCRCGGYRDECHARLNRDAGCRYRHHLMSVPVVAGLMMASTATRAAGTATTAGGQRYVITPDSSKATYSGQETFVGRGLATAVGSTGTIAGDLTINMQNPSLSTIGTITVDISKLASDSGQRDNRIRQQWLESTKFPTATFVPKRLEGLPTTAYTDGQELTFKIVGDLTVRNVTKEVTFDATGQIVGTTFTGTAKTGFNMTDFGFEPPSIAGVLNSENAVALTIIIEAKQAQ